MAKILLVEDDNNLREIYGERLIAEGYEIISAGDGEEALQTAVQEKPDLIISDVMMPKISGFDMLDILRQTPETKDVKIIMMTALSQAEDKTRADSLGADKYLVKSQVTLEDVARVVHDILGDGGEEESAEVISQATEQTAEVALPSEQEEVAPTEAPTIVEAPEIATAPEVVPAPEVVATPEVAPVTEPVAVTPEPAVAPVVAEAPLEAVAPTQEPLTVPETVTPEVTSAPEPVVSAAPELTAEPEEVSAPEVVATPEVAPVTEPVAVTPEPAVAPVVAEAPATNPILGATPTLTDQNTQVQAQDSQAELNEVAAQIEQFVASPAAEASTIQAPVSEPTEQELIHAQNAAEEPTIVSAQAAATATVNPPMPTMGVDAANPEPASSRKKVITPMNDITTTPDIHALYEQEMAKEAANSPVLNPSSGAVINGEYLAPQAPVADATNPIVDLAASPQEASANVAPLETLDVSQLSGIESTEMPSIVAPQDAQVAAPAPTDPNQAPAGEAPNTIAL